MTPSYDGHSPQEREEMLRKMQTLSDNFYAAVIHTGCHPFIEFTGLMNKYIDLCRAAHKKGLDFAMANTHTGQALPVAPHDMAYLAEKLDCIFGPTLRSDPQSQAAFLRGLELDER
jgi:hypothetical protein